MLVLLLLKSHKSLAQPVPNSNTLYLSDISIKNALKGSRSTGMVQVSAGQLQLSMSADSNSALKFKT